MRVAIICGSTSDKQYADAAAALLDSFGVTYKNFITSAHRSPNLTVKIASLVEKEFDIAIVIAGLSAALPGIIAAHTKKPVLGVPVASDLLGLDALFSIAQMPRGIPVASFGIGKKGAQNAALFAVRILALKDESLGEKLQEYIRREEEKIRKLNEPID